MEGSDGEKEKEKERERERERERGEKKTCALNPPCCPSGALDAFKKCSFLRGQKRGRHKGAEKGLLGKTTRIKLIHFPNNLENCIFLEKFDFIQIYKSKSNFSENQNCPYGPHEPL